ncbi:MAG: hypothetical protein M3Q10_07690 [Chloroflexota bacterium]|nr:hypothetical protein [Chloroflexota bacterium]
MVVELDRQAATQPLTPVEDLLGDISPIDAGYYRVKEVAVHATGLRLPGHMGLTDDGLLLVSEFGGGQVRDITEPGDYTDPAKGRWAWNLRHPGGILPLSDGRIIVAASGSGEVYDITESGAATTSSLLFADVPHPYGLVEFRNRIFASWSSDRMVGLVEIVPGERFESEEASFVHGFPVVLTSEPYRELEGCGGSWTTPVKDDDLYLGHSALGALFKVTPGGSFDDLRGERYAWGLNLPLGMIADPLDGNIYVTERMTGVIKRIPHRGGYCCFAEPFLAGFQDPNCIRFTGVHIPVTFLTDRRDVGGGGDGCAETGPDRPDR